MKNILDWIEEKKQQYESPGPRTMAQEPRIKVAELTNMNTPDLEQSEFLRPGETLETWEPNPFLKRLLKTWQKTEALLLLII